MENPIAFSSSTLARYLSIFHLHARYAGLLVWPRRLSADWSFACIPLVETWSDPRNLLSLGLYIGLVLVGVMARPWDVIKEWTAGTDSRASAGETMGTPSDPEGRLSPPTHSLTDQASDPLALSSSEPTSL